MHIRIKALFPFPKIQHTSAVSACGSITNEREIFAHELLISENLISSEK
jgi:hypothetical protein